MINNTMRDLTAEELNSVSGGSGTTTTPPPVANVPPAPSITIESIDPTVLSLGGGGIVGIKMHSPLKA
jgi:hypothetical protein